MAVIDRKKFWQCVNIDWKLIGLVKYLVIGSLKPLLNIIGGGLLRRPFMHCFPLCDKTMLADGEVQISVLCQY